MKKIILIIISLVLTFFLISCKAEEEPKATTLSGEIRAAFDIGIPPTNIVTITVYNDDCQGAVVDTVSSSNWVTSGDGWFHISYKISGIDDGSYCAIGIFDRNNRSNLISNYTTTVSIVISGNTTKNIIFDIVPQ